MLIGMPKNIRTPEALFLISVIVRSWKPVTENEIYAVLGLILLMVIVLN
jgi:hypothetical protein